MQAQDPADSFETLRTDLRLSRDDIVRVTDLSGSRIEGRVESVSADSLNLIIDGTARQISAASVRQISRQRPDSILSGVLIGLAAGAGGGLVAAKACLDYWSCGLNRLVVFLIGGPVAGGVIDALHHGHETVYEAPQGARTQMFSLSPVVNREERGIRIAFSF